MIYSLVINRKPVSWNQAYRKLGNGKGMFMTEEGKSYKNFVSMACREQIDNFKILDDHILRAYVVFCDPSFITKKGKPSKTAGDCDNFWKLTADAMCGALGVDDSVIWDVRLIKVYQENPRTFIKLKWSETVKYFDPYDFLIVD